MSNEVDEPPNQTASDQADIIDVLQIENEALRSQLGKLETTLERIELRQTQQFSGTFQDASSPVRKRSNNNNDTNTSYDSPSPFSPNNNKSNSNLPPITMNNLEEMMVKIQLAKNDAILHGESSREKLMNDITFLHDLLKQAKVEQTSNLTEIAQLKKQVKSQKVTCDKIMKRREQDKMIFVEMLKRERTRRSFLETKFSEAELKVRWLQQQMEQQQVQQITPDYDPKEYANLDVSPDIAELFAYILRYKPQEVELETSLKCFIPDYIPAVGEMDR